MFIELSFVDIVIYFCISMLYVCMYDVYMHCMCVFVCMCMYSM